MKTLKRLTAILSLILLTSCGASWQISTLNYDPIYEDENYIVVSDDIKIDTLSEFQFQNKLRNDLSFRLDFARYALSQPISFDWNNRLLGTRYGWNSPYYGYYWNRDQMWNDWAWGYTGWNSWHSPHRWSPFGYDRWGYNNWMGNVYWGYGYGWNNYYGWNGYYNNNWGWRQQMNNHAWNNRYRRNTVYVNGRRGSISDEVASNRRVRTNSNNTRTVRSDNNPRINLDNNVIIRDNGETVRIYRRPNDNNNNNNIRVNPNNNTRNNNWKPRVPNNVNNRPPVIRNNNTRPSYNNTRPSNNVRPRINNNNNTRSTSTNVNRSTNSRGGSGVRRN